MKNRWKTLFKSVVLAGVALSGTALSVSAQKNESVKQERLVQLDDLTFPEMIRSVPLDERSASLVRKFQEKEARDRVLKSYGGKNDCNVENFRNKEVLLITIPASKLFYPNETELRRDAEVFLNPIKRYLKDGDMYRVLLVMHTDNTGSEDYRERITADRSQAVFDWFDNQNLNTRYLFSYAYADEMPLNESTKNNDSMKSRDLNRRLEIYLVPGEKMAEQAKKGKIEF
ncbi:MAG: OmpA family protein [Muribaculaceae bacterium]|nr:OmpA family protein [Muribaculaceae bacterium]